MIVSHLQTVICLEAQDKRYYEKLSYLRKKTDKIALYYDKKGNLSGLMAAISSDTWEEFYSQFYNLNTRRF